MSYYDLQDAIKEIRAFIESKGIELYVVVIAKEQEVVGLDNMDDDMLINTTTALNGPPAFIVQMLKPVVEELKRAHNAIKAARNVK